MVAMQFARRLPPSLALISTLALALPACKGDSGSENSDESEGGGDTIYERLGGADGIHEAVTEIVVDRVAPDPKINGYFLNSGVNVTIVIDCLATQLGSLTGGPEVYPNADCRDMATAHEGLGISDADFMDLAGHVVAELTERGVAQEDIDVIVGALTGMYDDIVEDPDNNLTVYQRAGRLPGIQGAVAEFYTIITTDPAVMAFFSGLDIDRLEGCLSRLVCSIDGPCEFGGELPGLDPMFPEGQSPCMDIMSAHEGLNITIDDFNAVAADLTMALDNVGLAPADRDAILGVVGPLCNQIVTDTATCP
jgi:hemoglobin